MKEAENQEAQSSESHEIGTLLFVAYLTQLASFIFLGLRFGLYINHSRMGVQEKDVVFTESSLDGMSLVLLPVLFLCAAGTVFVIQVRGIMQREQIQQFSKPVNAITGLFAVAALGSLVSYFMVLFLEKGGSNSESALDVCQFILEAHVTIIVVIVALMISLRRRTKSLTT